MNKWAMAMLMGGVVFLTACGEQKPAIQELENKLEQKKSADSPAVPEALKAIDKSLSGADKIANAKDVQLTTVPFNYELPKAMKEICNFDLPKDMEGNGEGATNFCTEINIQLAKIEPTWIEQVVNKAITDDDNPKLIKFKRRVDDFVNEHLAYIQEIQASVKENGEEFTSAPLYSWTQQPELLPSFNNVVQIVINDDTYMGGAHGMQTASYLLFDMDLKTQIQFNDIFEKDKQGQFDELAYQAFKDYLKNELELKTNKEIKEYEETWKFEVTDNFYFGKNGVTLVYQPYEMGAYAQGFIEIVVPYDKLNDILKVQYLPNTQL